MISGHFPREGPARRAGPQPQALEDSCTGHLSVEGVEMHSMRHVPVKQLPDEGRGVVDAVVSDGLVVVLERRHHLHDLVWHVQLAEFDDVSQGLVRLDRHDTWQGRIQGWDQWSAKKK